MKTNECSHGKTWQEQCPHCEMIWWLDVRGHAIRNLARANAKIAELNAAHISTPDKSLCKIAQFSDQARCLTCDTAWDMNDPSPPECPLLQIKI